MKTLDQIYQRAESRIDVLTLPSSSMATRVINQPGSYYLSTNLVGAAGLNGIDISTNDVELDLNGFTLIGVSNRVAILSTVPRIQRIRIHNGQLTGWKSGLDFYTSASASNIIAADLRITLTGEASGNGIIAAGRLQALRCRIEGANASGAIGIYSTTAEGSVVDSCTLFHTGGGILLGNDAIVHGCQIVDCVGNTAISVYNNSLVTGNIVERSQQIRASSGSVVSRNIVSSSVASGGIQATGNRSRIEDNQAIGNTGYGIYTDLSTTNNLVIRNFASGNSSGNYNLSASSVYGPIVNSSGVTTNHPWANFSF